MVDTMAVLGAAACAKLTADRLVRDLVTYVRDSRVIPPESTLKKSRRLRTKNRLSRSMKASTSGLGPRPSSLRRGKKVSRMTDAELEAELEKRRRRRAKERDIYSRALRYEKLAALESELTNLRREIGRIDPYPSKSALRPGTPHSVHWEPLPKTRRSIDMQSPFAPDTAAAGQPVPPVRGLPPARGPPPTSGPPPPPPPLPPPPGATEDEGFTIDPQQRKREKEQRQKRREAKKKEREQAQEKLTLVDIIRSAGPDPMKLLKPASRKPADLEKEEFEKQKREREEREMRQEQERIELEKKAIENMGRRVIEQTSTKNSESSPVLGPENLQQNSKSEDAANEEAKKHEDITGPKSKKGSSHPLDAATTVSENASIKVNDDISRSSQRLDGEQDGESKEVEDRNDSESDAKLPTRSRAQNHDTPSSSNVFDNRASEVRGEKKIPCGEKKDPSAPEKRVSMREGTKGEAVLQVKSVSMVQKTDTENISPNAASTNSVPGNKPERKIADEVDETAGRSKVV